MTSSAAMIDSRERPSPRGFPPRSRSAALRAALATETRIAEALAQRSRGLVTLVEQLSQRALADAADIADASRRIDALCRSLHAALAQGDATPEGDLRALAGRTLGGFDMASGPRILIEGPAVALDPDAGRLVSLALFDLASRCARFGALSVEDGRVALEWRVETGGLRLTWREFGVRPGTERMRRGLGAALQALLSDRFGAPLRQWATPFGLIAELAIPHWALVEGAGPTPRRVLVAVEDAAVAVKLGALLMACGVAEVGTARSATETEQVLALGGTDLVLVDPATAHWAEGAAVLVMGPGDRVIAGAAPAAVRFPASASGLAEAMAVVLRGRPGGVGKIG